MWPRIVAESLRAVDRWLPTAPGAAAQASLDDWDALLRAAERPGESVATPPSFLLPHQHASWRRVRHAMTAWGGALLAEPVGRGKTWIALAAAVDEGAPAAVVVPAILAGQWRRAAARAGVAISCISHEAVSRGHLPPPATSLVIIDEAHRFRHASTRRVRHLAPWSAGRRMLLLTGTPIINRTADLIALLRLFAAEDALALDGWPELTAVANQSRPPAALRRLVVRTSDDGRATIARRDGMLEPGPGERARAARAVGAIGELTLSVDPAIRRLLRTVLLDAAASSDAAWRDALGRYRALLLQSRDAGGASRSMLRHFAGPSLDQLVLWPMLGREASAVELPDQDIATVDAIRAQPAADGEWLDAMKDAVADGATTVCFTRHRATVTMLQAALGPATAWVTGAGAGIGPHRMRRETVLSAFGPERPAWSVFRRVPTVLVATDIAAEGLDLQSAARIVHVDLPWTATRVDQREGRLLRIGQMHGTVQVLCRQPAPAIVTSLGPQARLRVKRAAATAWLDSLTASPVMDPAVASGMVTATFRDDEPAAALVAVRLERDWREGVILVARQGSEPWRLDPFAIDRLLARARSAEPVVGDDALISATAQSATQAAIVFAGASVPGDAMLITRVHRMARSAAHARDGAALARLDRLLRFVSAPPTLGARRVLDQMRLRDDRAMARMAVPDLRMPSRPHAVPLAVLIWLP
ncbi:MAG TPA: DEAD/DEAH box helicase [Gemmatimonadales bacterium]|jgi:hypothetical protein